MCYVKRFEIAFLCEKLYINESACALTGSEMLVN